LTRRPLNLGADQEPDSLPSFRIRANRNYQHILHFTGFTAKKLRQASTHRADEMHNARNWRPVTQNAGSRRVTELGFAGWGVVRRHWSLLFQRWPPGRNLRDPSVVRPFR